MEKEKNVTARPVNRRSFLKKGVLAGGAATIGAGFIGGKSFAFAQERSERPTKGDIAILRFLNALEQIEADLWLQYAELGGVQDSTIPGANGGNPLYVGALEILDGDMAQYIVDNTDDEISHAAFLKAYLESKGADAVDLSRFATIPGSTAQGSSKKLRLTNLTQLTVDTSFWSRYRSITNPDFDRGAPFVQAVPSLNVGRHTAIPRTDADTAGSSLSSDNTQSITAHLQAIAFTAGFHFAFIEQGGTSLYPTLAQQVSNVEVLRVLLSVGPSETMHFQTWQDKAGNALPVSDTDNGPGGTGAKVTFSVLSAAQGETNPESLKGDTLQANLIMPEPTHFLDKDFPPVAIIRPTSSELGGAVASFNSFVTDGLFIGQKNQEFFQVMRNLAEEADAARRDGNGRDE
ncbi:MAG: ferritin-like domain-containing protein [Candidatus Acidiferrales bacterium]